MKKFVALLRGINVGGKNIIKMSDLKACFVSMGFSAVATYIQSGNVVFAAKAADAPTLAGKIERALSARFKFPARVVVVTRAELGQAVRGAPKGFGASPEKYRYDVVFLKKPLVATIAMKSVSTRPGVDEAHAGKRVLYFSRLIARAAESRLPKLVQTAAYAHMTIRNWNTTTALLALMDGRAKSGRSRGIAGSRRLRP